MSLDITSPDFKSWYILKFVGSSVLESVTLVMLSVSVTTFAKRSEFAGSEGCAASLATS